MFLSAPGSSKDLQPFLLPWGCGGRAGYVRLGSKDAKDGAGRGH